MNGPSFGRTHTIDSAGNGAAQILSLKYSLFAGEFLFRQFRTEVLFFFPYKLLVSTRIDERVSPIFQERIFFFQPEITAVGTEENITWQRLQNAPHTFVVCGDLRIISVVNELIAWVDVRAAYDYDIIGLSSLGHSHRPSGAAFCMPWGKVGHKYRSTKSNFVAIMQHPIHLGRRIEKLTIVAILKIRLAAGFDDRHVAIHYHVACSCHFPDLRTASIVVPVCVTDEQNLGVF